MEVVRRESKIVCRDYGHTFVSKANLRRHVRQFHQNKLQDIGSIRQRIMCCVSICHTVGTHYNCEQIRSFSSYHFF